MTVPKPPGGVRPLPIVLVFVSVLVLVSATLARAQTPAPSEPAAAARAFHASLSADQRRTISAALAAYSADLAALARRLGDSAPAAQATIFLPQLSASGSAAAVVSGDPSPPAPATMNPDQAALGAAFDSINGDLQSLQAAIEADLASILSPEQMQLYRAAVAVAPAAETSANLEVQQSAVSAVGCFNAAQWTDYAFAYTRAAKAFAFMAAFNVDFGTETPAAVQAYISFNEAEAYAVSALGDLSTASVLITAADPLVQDINGGTLFGVKGAADLVVAEDRIELATGFALADYEDSGGTVIGNVGVGGNYFAYFAFAYGDIADFFADEALARSPNCY